MGNREELHEINKAERIRTKSRAAQQQIATLTTTLLLCSLPIHRSLDSPSCNSRALRGQTKVLTAWLFFFICLCFSSLSSLSLIISIEGVIAPRCFLILCKKLKNRAEQTGRLRGNREEMERGKDAEKWKSWSDTEWITLRRYSNTDKKVLINLC